MKYFTQRAIHGMNAKEATDRRFDARFKVSTPVFVRLDGKQVAQCRARNLSASGVFLDSKSLGLTPGQEVELVFSIEMGKTVKLHRRSAQVVYVKFGGTGLTFRSRALPQGAVSGG